MAVPVQPVPCNLYNCHLITPYQDYFNPAASTSWIYSFNLSGDSQQNCKWVVRWRQRPCFHPTYIHINVISAKKRLAWAVVWAKCDASQDCRSISRELSGSRSQRLITNRCMYRIGLHQEEGVWALAHVNGWSMLSAFAQLSGLARREVTTLKRSNAERDFPFSVQWNSGQPASGTGQAWPDYWMGALALTMKMHTPVKRWHVMYTLN